ncbi:MAG: hypothetical protein BJ554DRAFT_89 [Olpidium bornovanus]|uniref:Uncharacterized protein n=1 Tax=Olpidium bornovanus TaxID=278681 RepID=A0A8H8A1C2_9FUNG|nr:MAG: hypothetical protein BJ554DRAFT_89 [Olpidium bornovanus]
MLPPLSPAAAASPCGVRRRPLASFSARRERALPLRFPSHALPPGSPQLGRREHPQVATSRRRGRTEARSGSHEYRIAPPPFPPLARTAAVLHGARYRHSPPPPEWPLPPERWCLPLPIGASAPPGRGTSRTYVVGPSAAEGGGGGVAVRATAYIASTRNSQYRRILRRRGQPEQPVLSLGARLLRQSRHFSYCFPRNTAPPRRPYLFAELLHTYRGRSRPKIFLVRSKLTRFFFFFFPHPHLRRHTFCSNPRPKRLSVQTTPHRGLGRRQVVPALAVCRRYVHRELHLDHWRRFCTSLEPRC